MSFAGAYGGACYGSGVDRLVLPSGL